MVSVLSFSVSGYPFLRVGSVLRKHLLKTRPEPGSLAASLVNVCILIAAAPGLAGHIAKGEVKLCSVKHSVFTCFQSLGYPEKYPRFILETEF